MNLFVYLLMDSDFFFFFRFNCYCYSHANLLEIFFNTSMLFLNLLVYHLINYVFFFLLIHLLVLFSSSSSHVIFFFFSQCHSSTSSSTSSWNLFFVLLLFHLLVLFLCSSSHVNFFFQLVSFQNLLGYLFINSIIFFCFCFTCWCSKRAHLLMFSFFLFQSTSFLNLFINSVSFFPFVSFASVVLVLIFSSFFFNQCHS